MDGRADLPALFIDSKMLRLRSKDGSSFRTGKLQRIITPEMSLQPETKQTKGESIKLSGGGLTEYIEAFEARVKQGGLNETELHRVLVAAVERFGARVHDVGRSAGWSKAQTGELLDAILSASTIKGDGEPRTLKSLLASSAAVNGSVVTEVLDLLKSFSRLSEIGPFGLKQAGQSALTEIELGSIRHGANECGPLALFYLVQSARGEALLKGADACQSFYKDLVRRVDPGRFGTDPEKLPEAVRGATGGEFELTEHKASSSHDALALIDRELAAGRAVVVKYGASLFNQHYDCVRTVDVVNGTRVYATSSGFFIPESRFIDMLAQIPYRNHVWTIDRCETPTLPPTDLDAARREFAGR